MQVLIADDDAVSRRMLQAVAQAAGYDVLTAADGRIAWEMLLADGAPRLVTLDWMMPGLDGLDVCRRLRALHQTRPTFVIMVTGRESKQDVVAGLSAGADDFITKPFDPSELRARLAVGRRVVDLQIALNDRIHELSDALAQVKTLQGLIPICMHCHRIRTDSDSWQKIEHYISAHSDAHFTHGVCPKCLEAHYPVQ